MKFIDSKYFNLIREMAISEFKLRDQATILGFLWTLLYPVMQYAVLYAIFEKWMGNKIEMFAVYLIIGVLQYNFFSRGTTAALTCLIRRTSLVCNFIFPREIVVLSTLTTVLFIHVLESLVMLLFVIIFGAQPSFTWLCLFASIFVEFVFILGVSLFLARLALEFRDIIKIWEIVVYVGFFLTPVFYTLDIIAPMKRKILLLNPLTHIITQTRVCIINGDFPSFIVLAVVLFFGVILSIAGYAFYKSGESRFVEKLR